MPLVFGRVIYVEFIKASIRGLPDLDSGRPALDLTDEVTRRGADAVPSGYGKPFQGRVFRILSRFSDPQVAEEAMSQVLFQVARGKLHIEDGSSLHQAESYVIAAAMNAARDILRARGRRREDSLVRERDNEQATVDVQDPEAFARLDKLMPPSELRDVLRELGNIHPRAPEWLRARLDGDSGQEIATGWGTTPSYVSRWQKQYLPEIKRVVEHHLRQARRAYSYDRRCAATSRP